MRQEKLIAITGIIGNDLVEFAVDQHADNALEKKLTIKEYAIFVF